MSGERRFVSLDSNFSFSVFADTIAPLSIGWLHKVFFACVNKSITYQ
jgi:hypothetical protein